MATSGTDVDFPLHRAVWNDIPNLVEEILQKLPKDDTDASKAILESKDPRGRTPLMLAVALDRTKCAEILLRSGADATSEAGHGWSVVDEAVANGNPDLVQMIMRFRDYQRSIKRRRATTALLEKLLANEDDFYVEMRWEFHSWIPFLAKMCPRDSYRVYKKGAAVRIDTSLLGFEDNEWKHGHRTFIFRVADDGINAEVIVIDHDDQSYSVESMPLNDATAAGEKPEMYAVSSDTISTKLSNPITTTYVDIENIAFERKYSGFWGLQSEKTESIGGYVCKVYTASNVQIVTKTRTEHLSEEDKNDVQRKQQRRGSASGALGTIMNWLQGAASEIRTGGGDVTYEEYFNSFIDLKGRDIGKGKEISARSRKFNAHLWLADGYPLSLPDQVAPIIDLMAAGNSHFARLKHFITLQLPSGFPVKIEIPLFHLMTATVTFDNVYGKLTPVDLVTFYPSTTTTNSDNNNPNGGRCEVDASIFDIPNGYLHRDFDTIAATGWAESDDDALLQFAIQQSLHQQSSGQGGGGGGGAGGAYSDGAAMHSAAFMNRFTTEDLDIQRAIDASLRMSTCPGGVDVEAPIENEEENLQREPSTNPVPLPPHAVGSDELAIALAISLEEEERRRHLVSAEEEELAKALELSMKEM